MKKTLSLLITLVLIVGSLTGCGKKTENPSYSSTQMDTSSQANMSGSNSQQDNTEIHYQMDFEIDEENNKLTGNMTVSITNTSGHTWNDLCFRDYPADMYEEISEADNTVNYIHAETSLSDVTIADSQEKLKIKRDNEDSTVIYIELDEPLKDQESLTLQMKYEAELMDLGNNAMSGRTGYYNYSGDNIYDFGKEGTIYNMGNFFPILSYYKDGGWATTNMYLFDGECFFSDIADFEVSITMPEKYTVVASGENTDKSSDGGKTKWTFTAENMRDFAFCASDIFEMKSDTIDGITVNSYYLEGEETYGEQALQAGLDSIEVFNQKIGKYPYSELDIIETRLSMGGMEYPSLVMISDTYGWYIDDQDQDTADYLRDVVAHEVAHQWFYAVVGDDQYREAWLDESLASYMETIYRKTYKSQETVDQEMDELEQYIAQSENNSNDDYYKINLAYDEFEDYVTGVYSHGKVFLYRVMQAMGEETFYNALSEFYSEFSFKEATTEDLVGILQKYAPENDEVNALIDKYIK